MNAAASLYGRATELAALELAVASFRLVNVVGAPGVGKTSLVEAWLATRAATPRGVMVRAEGAKTEDEVAAKVAGALGVPMPAGGLARFAAVLAAEPIVLVLDGADEVAAVAAETFTRWLAEAPSLTLVVTSGAPLGHPGESVVRVPPLGGSDATALFEARATRAGWKPKRTPEESRVIAGLVDRLDGLPLGIELAAARASVLSPKQLLERLEHGLGILERREAGGATVSLRAAFALSWSLLDATSQRVLAAVSVYAGAFSFDAMEAVLSDVGAPAIATAIDGIVSRSLATRESSDDDEVRFRLLSTVRAFARGELDARDTEAVTVARADAFTVALAERLARALETREESVAAARLHDLADDLAGAIGRGTTRDPMLAARGAIAFAAFAAPRGSAPVELLSKALVGAKRTGDRELVARLAYGCARARARLGMNDEARALLDDALERTRETAERGLVARILIERGKLRLQRGDFAGARDDLDEATRELDETDDAYAAGLAANERGRLEEALGALDTAATLFLGARARFRHAGSVRMDGIALQNLGVVRYAQGRFEEARSLLEEALELHRLAHDPASAADNLLNAGSVHLTAGRLDLAESITVRALEEERRLGNRRFEGLALGNLALVAHERGHWQVSFDRYQRALTIFRETGDKRFAAVFTPFAAACEATLGLHREAAEDFASARAAFEAVGDPGNVAVLETLLGIFDLHPGGGAPPNEQRAGERLRTAEAILKSGSEASRSPELALAVRLLRSALAARPGESSPRKTAPVDDARHTVTVGPDVRWFAIGGHRIQLGARAAPRMILARLIEHRLHAPGVGLSPEALFQAGWPGQKASFEAARARVYTAIRTLRRLGLDAVLLRQDDGYLLDPSFHLETQT